MWNSSTVMMIVEGTFATIYMTLLSTLMAYVIGLPVGVALVVTGREGLKPNAAVNKVLDVIVNITRSIPITLLTVFPPSLANPSSSPHNDWKTMAKMRNRVKIINAAQTTAYTSQIKEKELTFMPKKV